MVMKGMRLNDLWVRVETVTGEKIIFNSMVELFFTVWGSES